MAEEVKGLAPTSCAPSINSISLPPMLKRKRSDSSATEAPVPTKVRTEDPTVSVPSSQPLPAGPTATANPSDPVASPIAPSPPVATVPPPAQAATGTPDVSRLRDTITAQLSLEVLLKHNELRLIDQEIAKCQVALEQLRRCAEIPYPGSSVAGLSTDVSAGTGASVLAPGNGPPPLSPAPWGVTEGPYSRHYSRWLLPDPRFDGGEVESGAAATAGAGFPLVEGRSTRGNPVDFNSLAGKTRPSRNSTSVKLQALPSGYPPVKEKAGPMLIRRKSDGVLVKLVCLDCRRDNFSSTQGFINHCRIAHNRNFASHDAAAVASGEPVEVDDAGAVVGGRTESTSSTAATPGYVHPLIRSAQLPTPSKDAVTPQKQPATNSGAVATPPATVEPRCQSVPAKVAPNPAFLASPATPHLSALTRDRGLGLNLDKLVTEAKTPVDLSGISDDDSDHDEDRHRHSSGWSSREPSQQAARAARQPARMPTVQTASQRSESRKGLERATHGSQPAREVTPSRPQSYKSSYLAGFTSSLGHRQASPTKTPREGDGVDHTANMSPHTVESNQAPSLVSDDDYGVPSESDSSSSSDSDDQDEDFRHIQVEDDERSAAPSAASTEGKPTATDPTPQPAPTLTNPLKQSRTNKLMMPRFGNPEDDDKRADLVRPADDASQQNLPAGHKPAPGL